MKFLKHPDIVAACIFCGLGIAFMWGSMGMEFGSAVDMGPAFFPRTVGAALVALAALIALRGILDLRRHAGLSSKPLVRLALGPIAAVFLAMSLFAVSLQPLGYVLASLMLMVVGGAAARDRRWREVLISALVVSLLSGLLFVVGLKLQASLWPWA